MVDVVILVVFEEWLEGEVELETGEELDETGEVDDVGGMVLVE
jgi:hypothetical protein